MGILSYCEMSEMSGHFIILRNVWAFYHTVKCLGILSYCVMSGHFIILRNVWAFYHILGRFGLSDPPTGVWAALVSAE
jgi:hypothetical protein